MAIVSKWTPSKEQLERDKRANELLEDLKQLAPYEALELQIEVEALRHERKEAHLLLQIHELPDLG